jgi:F-type H+-transporting ATPase subunit 8
MPQLVPFYFINEVVFAFSVIVIVHYLLSKYILPRIINLFMSRLFTVLLQDIESHLPW